MAIKSDQETDILYDKLVKLILWNQIRSLIKSRICDSVI